MKKGYIVFIVAGVLIFGVLYLLGYLKIVPRTSLKATVLDTQVAQSDRMMIPEGIFVDYDLSDPFPTYVLDDANISGFNVNIKWSDISISAGNYNYTTLDNVLTQISDANKKIILNVEGGDNSPDWVKQILGEYNPTDGSGGYISFVEFLSNGACNPDGSNPERLDLEIPIPWQNEFKGYVTQFISDFSAHLKTLKNADNKDIFDDIYKVNGALGVNRNESEMRLPYQENLSVDCLTKDNSTDATTLWLSAGYTGQKVIDVVGEFTQKWLDEFPSRLVGFSIVRQNGFPTITKSGAVGQPGLDYAQMVVSGINKNFITDYISANKKPRIAIESGSYISTSNPYAVVTDAKTLGAYTGYFIRDSVYKDALYDSGCQSPQTCSQAEKDDFAETLDDIASTGSLWVVIYPKNVLQFGDIIAQKESLFNIPPTSVSGVVLTSTPEVSKAEINWVSATDNSGYVEYIISLDGVEIGRTILNHVTITDFDFSDSDHTISIGVTDSMGNLASSVATIVIPKVQTSNGGGGGNGGNNNQGYAPGVVFNPAAQNTATPLPTNETSPVVEEEQLAFASIDELTGEDNPLPITTGLMKTGRLGYNVEILQAFLAESSEIYPEGLITGKFGAFTRAAVIRFQEEAGLVADGIVGRKTIAKINEVYNSARGQDLFLYK